MQRVDGGVGNGNTRPGFHELAHLLPAETLQQHPMKIPLAHQAAQGFNQRVAAGYLNVAVGANDHQ